MLPQSQPPQRLDFVALPRPFCCGRELGSGPCVKNSAQPCRAIFKTRLSIASSFQRHVHRCGFASENEGVGIRHRTTSVGFYIGDPCIQTCSSVLHHVFCNHTSRRCECRREHPVNINNRQCVKASALGSHCAYHEVCVYSVAHSSCQSSKCRCIDGHEPDAESIKCTPKRAPAILDGTELTTMVSVIVALLLFMALFCLVLRLFSKSSFGPSSGDRTADAGSPPPNAAVLSSVDGSLSGNGAAVGTTEGPASRRTFRNSVDIAGPR
ncbi:uncharacterized protein [Dermacentor albipictus]